MFTPEEIQQIREQLNGYIRQDATGIEKEISQIIKEHYRENIRKDVQFRLFPIKKLYDFDGNIITDFDYAIAAIHPISLPNHAKNVVTSHNKYDLIIVEAKTSYYLAKNSQKDTTDFYH